MDSTQDNPQKTTGYKIAGYEVFQLVTDRFRLDGGAMFGSVPKVLWERRIPADEENRIQLCTRILVLCRTDRVILIDVGLGRKWSEKQRSIYAMEHCISLEPPQEKLFPHAVSDVILTHMHFDHGGGATYYNDRGVSVPCFPKARHYLQQENWERAQHPGPRERATYFEENVTPLKNVAMMLTQDNSEILPGIRVFCYRGHTAGMQGVLIGNGPGAIWYPADLIPTAHHISLPYIMGYDLCSETTLAEKTKFLTRCVDEGWKIVFEHDADTACASVERDGKGGFQLKDRIDFPVWQVCG